MELLQLTGTAVPNSHLNNAAIPKLWKLRLMRVLDGPKQHKKQEGRPCMVIIDKKDLKLILRQIHLTVGSSNAICGSSFQEFTS